METVADYDSAAVRAAARNVKRCADTLENEACPKLRTISREIPSHFEGNAANALEDRVAEMSTDVNTICGSLTTLAKAMFSYADALERTAEQLAKEM